MLRSLLSFFLAYVAVSSACYGQSSPTVSEIRVRTLDYKTGRPIKHRLVEVMLADRPGPRRDRPFVIFQKTGTNGSAVFQIPAPQPSKIWVMADFPCTRQQAFGTFEVLERGIVGDHADFELCKHPTNHRATAQPGEIVIYIRRLNPWLRFWRFWWEVFEG